MDLIRRCAEEDIEAVRELEMQWQEENSTYGFIAGSTDCLRMRLGDYFLIALCQGGIAGFTYGSVRTASEMAIYPDGTSYLEVESLYVRPEYRDQGIGGRLLDALLEAAKANGIVHSCLYSSAKAMDSILRFYRKHGYDTWYVQMFK